jgi:hypothetical protein
MILSMDSVIYALTSINIFQCFYLAPMKSFRVFLTDPKSFGSGMKAFHLSKNLKSRKMPNRVAGSD